MNHFRMCANLSRLHPCVNMITSGLFQKHVLSGVRTNPSHCSKFFRTKKSMGIQDCSVSEELGKEWGSFFSEPFSLRRLKKPFLFTVFTGTGSYIGCTIWNYENYTNRGNVLSFDMRRTSEPEWRKELRHLWLSLHPGEKLFVPILFANVVVFAAWAVPRFQMTMFKYFASNPQSKALCASMLLSVFSHQNIMHLLANMFVLHSFISSTAQSMGKEQFLGFYLTAGVTSSLVSYIHKMLTCRPGFSLGASGAIMAVLGYICVRYPNTELGILFVPYLTFSADKAIMGIVLLDALGILFRWRLFDHAAHLGGTLFGVVYAKYGDEMWAQRGEVIKFWKRLRKDS